MNYGVSLIINNDFSANKISAKERPSLPGYLSPAPLVLPHFMPPLSGGA